MNASLTKDILIGLVFLTLQTTVFKHLSIFGVSVDIVLLYLVWLMTNRERTSTLFFAAIFGLAQDMFLDIWGINMFSKVLITFIAQPFVEDFTQNRPFITQIGSLIFGVALLHNLIFLGIAAIATDYNVEVNFWQLCIGNSIYTTIVGSFVYLFKKEN